MKKIALLFFIFCNLHAQEWINLNPTFNPPGTYHFTTGNFFDEYNGWALEYDNGMIINTTDGGVSWNVVFETNSIGLGDIFILNTQKGWIILGDQNPDSTSIFITNNGGLDWEKHTFPFFAFKIYFINENTGFCKGGANLYRTDNGGISWEKIELDQPDIVFSGEDIFFLNDQEGWILANNGGHDFSVAPKSYLLVTKDGGLTWDITEFPNDMPSWDYYNLIFLDTLNGVMTGGGSSIFYTSDGGVNWSLGSGMNGAILDMAFNDNNTGWAVGADGVINLTTDGGKNWATVASPTNYALCSIVFIKNSTIGYAFGSHGTVLKYQQPVGINDNRVSLIENELSLSVYPNPSNSFFNIIVNSPGGFSKLSLVNSIGESIKTIFVGYLHNGNHNFTLDMNDLPSGLYFCYLVQENNLKTIKILLLK